MARTATITDDQILNAAREVFIEEGFRAQSSKVAKLAGVSEGTIFKRFATKEHLFLAAMSIPYPPPWHQEVEQLAGTGDVKGNLVKIGVLLLTYFQQTMPRMMAASGVKMAGPPPPPPPGTPPDIDPNSPIMQDLNVIGGYLAREMQLGRLRQTDISILQMLIFGAFVSPLFRAAVSKQAFAYLDLQTIAENTIEVIWRGIAPDTV